MWDLSAQRPIECRDREGVRGQPGRRLQTGGCGWSFPADTFSLAYSVLAHAMFRLFELVSGIVKSDGLWFESAGNWPALGCASPLTAVRKIRLLPTLNTCSVLRSPFLPPGPPKQTVPITHHLFSPI